MKLKLFLSLFFFASAVSLLAQEQEHAINTIFRQQAPRASGGYGAITNKFTTIDGHYANMVELYGGWYINHRFLLGFAVAGVTNNIPVAPQHSAVPGAALSYEYGQAGLMTEYVIGSGRAIHVAFQLFSGGGFTLQYDRHRPGHDYAPDHQHEVYDENWFFVAEPGVKLEVNIFRWMRFSPGVSYRAAFNSRAEGLSDSALSDITYNATLKFGKF